MTGQFAVWYFLELPKKIKKVWTNYIWFFSKYFALAQLGKDLFSPWKGLVFYRQKRGFEIGDVFSAWFGNMISRSIGAMVRLLFILFGLATETFVVLLGALAYAFWLGYIPLIFYCFLKGISLLA